MKQFFFITVAFGLLSGTVISAKAQPAVSFERLNLASARVANDIRLPAASTFSPKSELSIENCSALQFKYAQLMDVEVESISNNSLYRFIEDWWATRYRYGGTGKGGIDCSAFTGELLNKVYNLSTPRTARAQYSVCDKIEKADLVEGDLVFFNTRGGISHVGVYLSNGYFTHSGTSSGVTISNLDDSYYSKKFITGGRINYNTNE